MDGTVKEASLDVRAFDAAGVAGAAGDESLVSGGAIFDAMTMGCFKFDSTFGGLDTAFDFSIFLAGLTSLTGLTGFMALTASALVATFVAGLTTGFVLVFVAIFVVGLATGLTIFLAATVGADFTSGFTTVFLTGFLTGLATVFTVALAAGFAGGFAGLTIFFAATLVTTLAATLIGVFFTVFFATVFIHCLPAKLVFIQIKQSTCTHQKTDAFTHKPPEIYLRQTVTSKYQHVAKIQSARGL